MQTANSHIFSPVKTGNGNFAQGTSLKFEQLKISSILKNKVNMEESHFQEEGLMSPQDSLWEN